MLILLCACAPNLHARGQVSHSRLRLENMEDYTGSWYYDCCNYSYWQPPPHQYSQLSRSGSDKYRDGAQSQSSSQYCLSNGPVRDRGSPAVSRSPSPQDKDRDRRDLKEQTEKKVSMIIELVINFVCVCVCMVCRG